MDKEKLISAANRFAGCQNFLDWEEHEAHKNWAKKVGNSPTFLFVCPDTNESFTDSAFGVAYQGNKSAREFVCKEVWFKKIAEGCHDGEWERENGVHQYCGYACPRCQTENCWNCGGGDGEGNYTCRSCGMGYSRDEAELA